MVLKNSFQLSNISNYLSLQLNLLVPQSPEDTMSLQNTLYLYSPSDCWQIAPLLISSRTNSPLTLSKTTLSLTTLAGSCLAVIVICLLHVIIYYFLYVYISSFIKHTCYLSPLIYFLKFIILCFQLKYNSFRKIAVLYL